MKTFGGTLFKQQLFIPQLYILDISTNQCVYHTSQKLSVLYNNSCISKLERFVNKHILKFWTDALDYQIWQSFQLEKSQQKYYKI